MTNKEHGDVQPMSNVFKQLDVNGDGVLSREEIKILFEKLNADISEKEVDVMLEAVDTDGSGTVDIEEFVKWVFGLDSTEEEVVMKVGGHRLVELGKVNWQAQFPVPKRYRERTARVAETHRRALTLQQFYDLGDFIQGVLKKVDIRDPNPNPKFNVGRITWNNINLYHINDLFVMPITEAHKCSFMEVVGKGPQDPMWFISHWWGTPFKDSLQMMRFHAKSRKIPKDRAYWMCTFANNQHCLEELAQEDLLMTPFAVAIMSAGCIGTLALLTEKTAMPFSRIWCVLEDYVTLEKARAKSPRHLFDVASIIPDAEQEIDGDKWVPRSAALLIDDGKGDFMDQGSDVAGDAGWFPSVVGKYGVNVDLTNAQASNENDRRNILRMIGDKADEINISLRKKFAPLALYNAATTEGDAAEVQRLMDSGLLGTREEALAVVDRGGSLAGAAEYTWGMKVVEYLLSVGANPDAWDEDGYSPVALTIERNKMKNLAVLLKGRADPNRKIKSGATPVGLAKKNNNKRALALLKEYGADMTAPPAAGDSSSSSSSSSDEE